MPIADVIGNSRVPQHCGLPVHPFAILIIIIVHEHEEQEEKQEKPCTS